ncbi:hypothetical protein D3C78_1129650 [compost metagenome]
MNSDNVIKKGLFGTCTILIIVILLSGCLYNNNSSEPKYPIGKDTVAAFGDATYQIYKTYNKEHELINNSEHAVIETHVYAYKEIDELVYTYGELGFTIINSATYNVRQYRDYNGSTQKEIEDYAGYETYYETFFTMLDKYEDFSAEERAVFDELKNKS